MLSSSEMDGWYLGVPVELLGQQIFVVPGQTNDPGLALIQAGGGLHDLPGR